METQRKRHWQWQRQRKRHWQWQRQCPNTVPTESIETFNVNNDDVNNMNVSSYEITTCINHDFLAYNQGDHSDLVKKVYILQYSTFDNYSVSTNT